MSALPAISHVNLLGYRERAASREERVPRSGPRRAPPTRSPVRRRGLIGTGIAQDPHPPVLVGDVDVAARIDQYVLGLCHHVLWQRTGICDRIGWDEPAGL